MTRQEFLQQNYGKALRAKVLAEGNADSTARHFATHKPEFLVPIFLDHDPSPNKRFGRWLIKAYLKDGFFTEDLSKAKETLELFMANQQKLSVEQRDIGSYKTLADLWRAVKGFQQVEIEDDSVSGKEKKRREKQLAYQQSIMLVDKTDVTIAIPTTEFAAKWWGRGTRWCTAADKDNAFYDYHVDGPLIVIDLKQNGKFQLYIRDADSGAEQYSESRNIQLMDADDAPLSKEKIIENWENLADVFGWMVCVDGKCLKSVPPEVMDYQIASMAIAENGHAIDFVPAQFLDYELYSLAVGSRAAILRFTPEKYKDEALYLTAVSNDGNALRYIPEEDRNETLCRIAVQQTGRSLYFVPQHQIDYDLCRLAVATDGFAIMHVPSKFVDYDLWRLAVTQNGNALTHVPESLRDYELCRLALQSNGKALAYVPDRLIDEELIEIAVGQDGEALHHVPKEMRTEALCRLAVSTTGCALYYVPENLRDLEMYTAAFEQHPFSIAYIPRDIHALLPKLKAPKCRWIENQAFIKRMKTHFNEDHTRYVQKAGFQPFLLENSLNTSHHGRDDKTSYRVKA